MSEQDALYRQCMREVIELHDFFQAWLEGSAPQTESVFRRFTDVNDPAFLLIGPHGRAIDLSAARRWIWEAWNTRPNSRLWTEAHTLRFSTGEMAVMTYHELQLNDGAPNQRLSTVVFRQDPAAPNGLVWVHVHETWMETER